MKWMKEITIDKFSDIMINLQNKGALNINLVTPTMYIPLIKKGIIKAKEKGLNIPIIYNTSGYENVEALKILDGLIDVYLPDFSNKSTGRSIGIVTSFAPALFISSLIIFSTF